MRVLAASTNYLDNREIKGWREHDESMPYPIDRIRLLRPLKLPPPANLFVSIWRFAFRDIALYAKALVAASRIVRRYRINIVCVGELVYGGWLGIALKKIFGCRLVVYTHGEEITTQGSGRLHGSRREEYLHAADKVIAVSSLACDALSRDMGLNQDKIVLIENGADIKPFSPCPRDEELIRMHGLEGRKVLLTVARMASREELNLSLRAIAELLGERNDVRCIITGDEAARAQLEDFIRDERLTDKVILLDQIADEELMSYLRLCDIVLMPRGTLQDRDTQEHEMVFRAATTLGKPVIEGSAGDGMEIAQSEESGLLLERCGTETLANAVRRLLRDDLAAARGLTPAKEADTESMARRFRTVCERLLRESGKRG
jgi:phosphatidylinositol alpha-1,6-mannosyltransferase